MQQIANALRAAILTRKLQPGDKLPSGSELAKRYDVARMTVQQAIRILRDENLIVSRQGSGAYVRERTERPVGLRPHLERAFEDAHVSVDFAGFSGETLHGAIAEPLDQIRASRLRPQSIAVRLLVPDPDIPWSLPTTVDNLDDSPLFRERARGNPQAIITHTEPRPTLTPHISLRVNRPEALRATPVLHLTLYSCWGASAHRHDRKPTVYWSLLDAGRWQPVGPDTRRRRAKRELSCPALLD